MPAKVGWRHTKKGCDPDKQAASTRAQGTRTSLTVSLIRSATRENALIKDEAFAEEGEARVGPTPLVVEVDSDDGPQRSDPKEVGAVAAMRQ